MRSAWSAASEMLRFKSSCGRSRSTTTGATVSRTPLRRRLSPVSSVSRSGRSWTWTPASGHSCTNARKSLRYGSAVVDRDRILERVRAICLELPETSERLSHGAPTFFVRDKRAFLMVLTNHHGDARFATWYAAPARIQQALVEAD